MQLGHAAAVVDPVDGQAGLAVLVQRATGLDVVTSPAGSSTGSIQRRVHPVQRGARGCGVCAVGNGHQDIDLRGSAESGLGGRPGMAAAGLLLSGRALQVVGSSTHHNLEGSVLCQHLSDGAKVGSQRDAGLIREIAQGLVVVRAELRVQLRRVLASAGRGHLDLQGVVSMRVVLIFTTAARTGPSLLESKKPS